MSSLRTLDEFINSVRPGKIGREWVHEPKFESLYVRYTRKYIWGRYFGDVLDIANVEVQKKFQRQGVFSGLIHRLRDTYFGINIHIEVASPITLQPLLYKLGFKEIGNDCFFLQGAITREQDEQKL